MIQISNRVGVFRMISSSFNIPILFIHKIRWICNLLPYHPISLHTLLSMILSNTRRNLQKNDFHALCVITIYSFYWLLKYRKDTLFVCYWTKNCNQMVQWKFRIYQGPIQKHFTISVYLTNEVIYFAQQNLIKNMLY